jgi:hypothetical protein
VALSLWGYLDDAPAELVASRRTVFSSAAHDYAAQRALVDRVPERALRLGPDEVAARVASGEWGELVGDARTA